MPDTSTTTTTATTASTGTTTTTAPWHDGIEAELIGWGQNKGWKIDDPKEAFAAAAKQAREAEKHFSVPPDQLLKMPKADAKPEDIKAFWQRLGTPADPKEYDFTGIKFNGEDLEASFADRMRASLAAAYVPKDKAVGIVKDVVKFLEDEDAAKAVTTRAAVTEAMTALKKSWGQDADYNFMVADRAIERVGRAAGLTGEQTSAAIQALKNAGVGRAEIMRMFHLIGSKTAEDTFVEGRGGGDGMPRTREGAIAHKSQIMADKDWVARYLKGGLAEKQLMDGLNMMIDGEAA